jgi:hypothetical protein
MTNTNWLGGLSPLVREQVFAEMRSLRITADSYFDTYRKLAPHNGEIPVGGRHIDSFVRGEAISVFIRGISRGLSPSEAITSAKEETKLIFENWNKHRKDYQVHRYLSGLDPLLQKLEINFSKYG